MTAAQVAASAAGAVDRTGPSTSWAIGGENLSCRAIQGHVADALGITATLVPADTARGRAAAEAQRTRLAEAGMETGYDPRDVARWQEEEQFLDPAPAVQFLGYGPDDIARAVHDTLRATQAHGGQGPASLRTPA